MPGSEREEHPRLMSLALEQHAAEGVRGEMGLGGGGGSAACGWEQPIALPEQRDSGGAGAADNVLLREGRASTCVCADKTPGKLRAGRMPSVYSPNVPFSVTAVRKSVPVPEQGDCKGGFLISALNQQLCG